MGQIKNIATESNDVEQTLVVVSDKAPVQQIDRAAILATVDRMRFIVPGGQAMELQHLTAIAQEAILYRTVPGRDVHYWVNKQGELQRVYDYKYLKNFANFKEKMISGDDSASVEDTYRMLTEEDKIRHCLQSDMIAAECRLVTRREREQFAQEVKRWRDIGLAANDAVELAKETYGELGTIAIGVIDPNEKDRWGNPIKPPKGWSLLQLAEKLAFKNAVNRKYGQPLADEMSAMAYHMAHKALPKHWQNIDPTEPIDVQARLADLEAIASEVRAESDEMTNQEHHDRLQQNGVLLHGPENDAPIGEDYAEQDWQRFVERILKEIPFYTDETSIKQSLGDFEYSPETEQECFDELAIYASQKADAIAQEK